MALKSLTDTTNRPCYQNEILFFEGRLVRVRRYQSVNDFDKNQNYLKGKG